MATFNPSATPKIGEIHPKGIFQVKSCKLEAGLTNEQEGKRGSGGRSMLTITIKTEIGNGQEGFIVDRMVFTPQTSPSDFAMIKLVDFVRATDTMELLLDEAGNGKELSDLSVLNEYANIVSALGISFAVEVKHSKRRDTGEDQANIRQYIAGDQVDVEIQDLDEVKII